MQKRNIRLMLAISFLQGMVFYASIATLYRQAIGITMFEISIIECISMALSLFLEVPWGLAADRIGYRRTMILCSFLYFVSKLIFYRADDFFTLLAERVLLSVVISGLSGVDESMLYLSCDKENAQKLFGLSSALGEGGMLFASTVYTLFLGDHYRTAAFWTMIAYGAAAVLSLFLTEVSPAESSVQKAAPLADFRRCLAHIRSIRGLIGLILCSSLFGEVCHITTVFLNQLQYERCGWNASLIGTAYILCTLSSLLSACSERFTKRFGEKSGGSMLLLICTLCCVVLSLSSNGLVSLICLLLLCLCSAIYFPLFSALENRSITIDSRATALSISTLIDNSISIGINLALGKAADISLKLTFLLGGALCLIALIGFRRSICVLAKNSTDSVCT